MPRIPQDEIERLKQEISVQRLAEARGIVLKPHGKDLIGLCPFHPDKTPSLVITPEKNLWNCLGACGTGGSVIDWVMKAEGVSFRHAVEILKEGELPIGSPTGKPPKVGTIRHLPPPVTFDAEDQELLQQVVGFYHQTLKESPAALGYLEKRGLNSAEMIDRFKIGFANRTLGLRLPARNRQTGAAIRERLIKLGIIRDTGHEHFNGSIVFPIFDEQGNVTEIYGRKAADVGRLRTGTAYHLYLPGPHKGVFNHQALTGSTDVILCESIIDALTFWCSGFRNVTTSYGVNGFTPDHREAFRKAEIKRVFIAYDRDAAGTRAAEDLAKRLNLEGYETFRVLFPRDMDANGFALTMNPPAKALELVLRNAQWMGAGGMAKSRTAGTISAPPAEIETPEGLDDSVSAAKGKNPTDSPEPASIPPEPESLQNQAFPLAAEEEPPEPPTTPEPAPHGTSSLSVEIRANEIILTIAERRWRVRGLDKNMSYDQMKVNLLASRGEAFFVDTFDLYSARSRASFQKQAADELRLKEDIIRSDLGKILLKLEELQDKQIREALETKETEVTLTPREREEAMDLLKSSRLIEQILEDFEKCGIVGEEINKLTGYLAAVSRKLENPLAIIIQSSSSAGKTSLMEAILAFMPDEDRVKYSAMTGQSLFYMGEMSLKHKILAIVEEEGAERASYALKLLQSEGELTIASTGKDPQTGRLVTHEYRVEGPVMIFVTTTSIDIDEELQNRCLVLTVNESREQTRAIHQRQRQLETLEGLVDQRDRVWTYRVHRNAQRLLETVLVANPHARELTFLDDTTRTRRDHKKYLTLIRAIALLHQYQRPRKHTMVRGKPEIYIEVTLEDIELANQLMHDVLGRSLDELPPQTRRFLLLLEAMAREACERLAIEKEDYRFYRRDILNYTGWSYNQLRVHMERLLDLEYVLMHRGHQGQRICYELIYAGQGQTGEPFCMGLLNVESIRSGKPSSTVQTLWGQNPALGGEAPNFVPPLCPDCSPFVGGVLGSEDAQPEPVSGQISEESLKKAYKGVPAKSASYRTSNRKSRSAPPAPKAVPGKKAKGNGSATTLEGLD